jgi:hypothetical protein
VGSAFPEESIMLNLFSLSLVLPRPFVKPPPTPPQGRVRLRPSTQAADTKAETDTVAQPWSAAMTELFTEALNWKPSDEIDPSDGKDRYVFSDIGNSEN